MRRKSSLVWPTSIFSPFNARLLLSEKEISPGRIHSLKATDWFYRLKKKLLFNLWFEGEVLLLILAFETHFVGAVVFLSLNSPSLVRLSIQVYPLSFVLLCGSCIYRVSPYVRPRWCRKRYENMACIKLKKKREKSFSSLCYFVRQWQNVHYEKIAHFMFICPFLSSFLRVPVMQESRVS